jgi:hypothetical protein
MDHEHDVSDGAGHCEGCTCSHVHEHTQRVNDLAIVSLVAAFFCWPVGLVAGILARGQIARNHEEGEGMAVAGIVISLLGAVATFVLFVALLFAVAGGGHGRGCESSEKVGPGFSVYSCGTHRGPIGPVYPGGPVAIPGGRAVSPTAPRLPTATTVPIDVPSPQGPGVTGTVLGGTPGVS